MTDGPRERLDALLVARGLFASRAQAGAAIAAGGVLVDGAAATKPAQRVPVDAEITATPAHPWVSRGGVKLAHALGAFGIDPAGAVALDVGASTGGFTDVLRSRGAAKVYAVDVGRGQLAAKIAADSGVVSLEGVDARALTAAQIPEPVDLVVCDASFIGLEKVLGPALGLLKPGGGLVALFKPQFQVGPGAVGKGGIVKDAAAVDAARAAVLTWLDAAGMEVVGVVESPITGGDGNREELVFARKT